MAAAQLEARDINDERVLDAMRQVPREKFVPEGTTDMAYQDSPLAIGHGQTISQPYIVAKMCQLLELDPRAKVLDVGAGSGYETAVLSLLADQVIGVEIIPELAKAANQTLSELGYDNAQVITGDGRKGYNPAAPYDGIKVAAAAEKILKPWKDQLKVGGRLVAPLKSGLGQVITRLTKHPGGFTQEKFDLVRFVPLVEEGDT